MSTPYPFRGTASAGRTVHVHSLWQSQARLVRTAAVCCQPLTRVSNHDAATLQFSVRRREGRGGHYGTHWLARDQASLQYNMSS
eukprot:3090826-Amphidinium_carterae.1